MYLIGRTGVGKSSLLLTLLLQDYHLGNGACLIDPHGDLVRDALRLVPDSRKHDLIYLDTPDASGPWHFNPLSNIPSSQRSLAVAGLADVFKKQWHDDWGPRLEHLLRNVLYTLFEIPGSSFADIPPLLTQKLVRLEMRQKVTNPAVRDFWEREFALYSERFKAVVTAPLFNKVGGFLADPRLSAVLTQGSNSFGFPAVMDQGRILLVNLSKGILGEGPSSLLGALLVSSLSLSGLGRSRETRSRRDFFVYLDEFQTFSTLSLATMLSELRKYRIGLVLAHQYLGQLAPDIRHAVLGNAGTIAAFRVGAQDAALLAREFEPTFQARHLIELPNYSIVLRLMIDAQVSAPFRAVTLPPQAPIFP